MARRNNTPKNGIVKFVVGGGWARGENLSLSTDARSAGTEFQLGSPPVPVNARRVWCSVVASEKDFYHEGFIHLCGKIRNTKKHKCFSSLKSVANPTAELFPFYLYVCSAHLEDGDELLVAFWAFDGGGDYIEVAHSNLVFSEINHFVDRRAAYFL